MTTINTPTERDTELPGYRIAQIFELRDRIFDHMFGQYNGIEIAGHDIPLIVQGLRSLLPQSVSDFVITETVRQLLGSILDGNTTRVFAWRVAGMLPQMRSGAPALPWRAPGIVEWVPFQVLRVLPSPSKTDVRYSMHLRALAGGPSGLLVDKVMSRSVLNLVSQRLGFTRSRGSRPFVSAYMLTSMRFYGKVDPQRSREMPDFNEIRCPAGCLEYNTGILNLRYRLNGQRCPRNYFVSCDKCAVGYTDCMAGCHKSTFVSVLCCVCGRTAPADPEGPSGTCVECFRSALAQPKGF
jgi:hypothetical protein